MLLLKRWAAVLAAALVLFALPPMALTAHASGRLLAEPYTMTPEELIGRIEETYDDARKLAGRRNFKGKCSTMVNCSTMALGIQDERYDGDGRDEYDLYDGVSRTDRGYDVIRYPAGEYDLESALNAITDGGTRDVYNLIVCFEGGRTASSSAYGHTCFVHGIVDGVVYYSESYDLYMGNDYYPEGEPIVCTIGEFANYYNIWACFEGVIHLDFPDETPPELSAMEVITSSENGFTLCFQATDDQQLRDVWAKVWLYGQTEQEAVTVPVTRIGKTTFVRVNSQDFGGCLGLYYVNCYAVDRKGNTAMTTTAREGVSLYQTETSRGDYRVNRSSAGLHNAPCVRVNGASTLQGVIHKGEAVTVTERYVNSEGQLWYLLADGNWIRGEHLMREQKPESPEQGVVLRNVVTVTGALNPESSGQI